ncbi:MAG TPA: hypothetical protein VJ783_29270 [Pirellulales bacterium]|nr:hypothetical protein [Pirellulales bacterium]
MKSLARGLQIVALFVLVPLAVILQLAERVSVGQMLTLWVAGASLFWIGRILEGYARAQ